MVDFKRYLAVFFVPALLFVFGRAVESANLLQNGGFEGEYRKVVGQKGETDFFAPGWFAKDDVNYEWLVFSESSDCHGGKKSQMWKMPPAGIASYLGIQQNTGPLKEAVEYQLSLWYKADKEVSVTLGSDKGGFVNTKLPAAAEWKQFRTVFVPKKDSTGVCTVLRITSPPASTTFIDDVNLSVSGEKEADAGADVIWQLGVEDKKSAEFVDYQAMEYARNSWLKNNSSYQVKNNVFSYFVAWPGLQPRPAIPGGISAAAHKCWMPEDEVITGLEIKWKEEEAGSRKLEIHTAVFKDRNGLGNDIRIRLPGKGTAYLQIPKTPGRSAGKQDLDWQVVFEVKPGENSILIEDAMLSRENLVYFDYLRLSKTDERVCLKPVIEAKTDKLGNIFFPAGPAIMNVNLANLIPAGAKLKCQVFNYYREPVIEELVDVNSGELAIRLPAEIKGYYEVYLTLLDSAGKVQSLGMENDRYILRYAVVEPPRESYPEDSPFGAHFGGSGLGKSWTIDWKSVENYANLAYLAGVKWNRVHSFDWRIIEPQKKEFYWDYTDRIVDICLRNHLNVMPCVCYTPKWASTSTDSTPSWAMGQPAWATAPPHKEDWASFIEETVNHYKDRIKYWEIWNEPAYMSCFWTTGSARDYYELLKTAYLAAKKADPQCTILTGGLVSSSAMAFFQEVLNYGGDKYFDIHAYHYCSNDRRKLWREILDKYGKKPMLNSEENISPRPASTPEAEKKFTENTVKIHVNELAGGSRRVFLFGLFDALLDNESGIIRTDYSPRPAFVAYRTMTHRLEGSKYQGRLNIAPGVEAHFFVKGDKPLLVLWSENKDGQDVNLNLGVGSAELVDIMDVGKKINTKDGQLPVALTSTPVFIEGGDKDLLMLQAMMKLTPSRMIIRAGKSQTLEVSLENTLGKKLQADINFEGPENWSISPARKKLDLAKNERDNIKVEIAAPENAGHSQYPLKINLCCRVGSRAYNFNGVVLITAVIVPPGENLLKNAGFEEDSDADNWPDNWWLHTGKNGSTKWDTAQGQSGKACLHGVSLNDKGYCQFAYNPRIPVIPGERYALSLWAKGPESGKQNGVQVTAYDPAGNSLLAKPGANCLFFAPGPYWKRFVDIYTVPAEAKEIGLYFSTCWLTEGEIFIDDVSLALLSDEMSLPKIEFSGRCFKAKGPVVVDGELDEWAGVIPTESIGEDGVRFDKEYRWAGTGDLSVKSYAMWDEKNLYLAYEVKDDNFSQTHSDFYTYEGDSVQFAVDPDMQGKDYNGFTLAETPLGPRIYRDHIFTTPELLQTMYVGFVKKGEGEFRTKRNDDGMVYEAKIPLTSIYPLELHQGARFGFSWLVNDNDGAGRKGWLEWSGGIGKTKNPAQYGMLTCE